MTISTEKLTMKVRFHRKWWVSLAVFVCGFYLTIIGDKPDKHKAIAEWISANGHKFVVIVTGKQIGRAHV